MECNNVYAIAETATQWQKHYIIACQGVHKNSCENEFNSRYFHWKQVTVLNDMSNNSQMIILNPM